ncbi:hypothetical protein LR48_Vigan02g068400 [Vigna angularis]|uniref:Ubiquitin-like protease family profile domain-containing protein n=1 Tax=Phaseolus angularis TaxID=3914 RepID=A0A0L9TWJ0_PHAAN|nr:hypothetical protein LR48_Vigan02g068400 [Vigna angularis]
MQFRASRESEEWKGTFAGQGRDDNLTTAIGRPEHPERVRGVPGAIGLRDYFGPTQKTPPSKSQETLRQMDLQWEERLNQSMRSMEQRFMEQLQEQKQIQRALEEKLHSMMQGNMGATETPTPPRVNNRGAGSAVEPTQYMDTIVVEQGRSSMYGFVEPQTIQPSGNTLQNRQHYLQTWMDESKRDVYLVPYIEAVIGKSRGQLVQILYPKCNQQLDSWECGFYVMRWIKTIIRVGITDIWNERFKSTSPIPEDTIRQIRQEWTAYLLQRWS